MTLRAEALRADWGGCLVRREFAARQVARVVAQSVALALSVALLASGTPVHVGVGLSLVFAIVAYVVVRRERRRWGVLGAGSPLTLTAVSWFAFFGVAGLGGISQARQDARLGSDPMNVVLALAVCIGSLLLVAIGYRLATMHARPIREGLIEIAPTAVKRYLLYVVLATGWAARLYLVETGRFGFLSGGASYTGPVNRLIQLAAAGLSVAMVVLAVAAWSPSGVKGLSRRAARFTLGANVVPLALTAMASGLKAQLVTDLVPVAVAYVMVRGRIPWRAIAIVGLYLVVVYAGIQSYRTEILTGQLESSARSGIFNSVRNSVGSVADGWLSDTPVQHGRSFWRHLTDEYADMLRNLAVVLHRTPDEVPYLGNTRLFTAPIFFLPTSALGAEDFNLGRYINVVYLNSSPTSSSPPTQPGDFFLSGGWRALVIGELVVGLFIGWLWRLFVVGSRSLVGVVIYASGAAAFVGAGLDWGTLSRGLLQVLGAAWLIMLALRRPQRAFGST